MIQVRHLVYPIMLFSTILALYKFPQWIIDGTLKFSQNPDDIYAIVGAFIAIYGAFFGSWMYWYNQIYLVNKKRKK